MLNDTTGGVVEALTTHDVGTLENGKTYYWRVDELDTGGVTYTGDVWSFTTIPDIQVTDPNLVLWYKMNEGDGTRVIDWSGYGHHGDFEGDPQWVDAVDASGLDFDGSGDAVIATGYGGVGRYDRDDQIPFTVTAWVYRRTADGEIVAWGGSGGGQRMEFRLNGSRLRCEHGSGNVRGDITLSANTWYHVAMTCPRAGALEDITFYVNGNFDPFRQSGDPTDPMDTGTGFDVTIARRHQDSTRRLDGIVDDVRIYDRVLTQEEIQEIMLRPDPYVAWEADPADDSVPQIENVAALSWSPGDDAVQHDVYFGTSASAVGDADSSSPEYKGRQAGTTYSLAGEGVEFAAGPYYWRIDEVQADSTVVAGRVWTFTVANYVVIDEMEDYNNFEPDRIFETWIDGWGIANNGSIVGHPDPDFGAGETFVETGIVHGGAQSMPFYYDNNMKYSAATMTLVGAKRNWTQHPVKALSLWYQGNAAPMGNFVEGPAGVYTMTGEGADIWGTEDHFHFAYKMLNGPGSITARVDSFERASNIWAKAGVMIRETLDPNSTNAITLVSYESNRVRQQVRTDTAGSSTGSGDVMPITVAPHWIKLERSFSGDFTASHANDVGGAPDAWEVMITSNVQMAANVYIGLAVTSHSVGEPATAVFSNVTTTGTVNGATFTNLDIGIQSNDPEPMFVSLKDASGTTATVYNPDPNAVNVTSWTEWGEYGEGILLSEFTDNAPGLNLANLDTITVGVGTVGNTQPGGSGVMFFDDIRVYGARCVPELAKPAGDINNDCVVDISDLEILTDEWLVSGADIVVEAVSDANLEAQYNFEGNLLDSSGNGYGGDPCGVIAYAAGQSGQALDVDGTAYVQVDSYAGVTGTGPRTCAAWIKTMDYGEIVSWGLDTNAQKWIFRVQESNGTLGAIRVEVSGGYVVGDTDVRDDMWHHVAAVLDESVAPDVLDVKLYVDGVQEFNSATQANPINTATTGVVTIGKAPWNNRPFTGQIDDVRIYSRAVPQAEIANLAGVAAGGTVTQPLANLLSTRLDPDLLDDEKVDFKDYSILADTWLDEVLWP